MMKSPKFFFLASSSLILNAFLLGFIFALITEARESASIIITVDTTTDSNILTACSDATPNDCSLRGAITRANGDTANQYTIVLPAGSFLLTLGGSGEDNNATGDLDLAASMMISGSTGTSIDANGIDRVIDVHSGVTVTLKGILIRGGHAPDGLSGMVPGANGANGDSGGGVRNAGALTIEGCTIIENQAGDGGNGGAMPGIPAPGGNGGNGGDGGGIDNSGTLTITHSTIVQNISGDGGNGGPAGNAVAFPGGNGGFGGNGGGIANLGVVTIINSTIDMNQTGAGGAGGIGSNGVIPPLGPGGPGGGGGRGGSGGAIFNAGGISITQSTLNGNKTGDGGAAGAAGVPGAAVPSLMSLPAGNGGDGGGIYNSASATSISLNAVTLSDNVTGNGGVGGAGAAGCMAPVGPGGPGGSGGNGGSGAGIFNDSISLLINTTTSGNRTGNGGVGGTGGAGGGGVAPGGNGGNGGNGGFGGGIYSQSAITLTNTTVADNQTGLFGAGGAGGPPGGLQGPPGNKGDGGGVAQSAVGVVNIRNTIIGNNAGSVDNDCWGTLTSMGYNLIEMVSPNCTVAGNTTGNLTGVDPKLFLLGHYGGATRTHALQNDSPAIDAGNPLTPGSGGNACPSDDQRGYSRADLWCDMGAFEMQFADNDTVQKCSLTTGSFTFGPTLVQIDITTLGTLSCISVKRVDASHPNAGLHYQTGRYWTITPTGINYTVNLTLPHSLPNHNLGLIGRYTGSGQHWDFGRTSSTPTKISLHNITQLSDWAVGSNTPPTLSTASKSGYINSATAFLFADFGNHLHDIDGDTLQQIKVISLPITGTLKLSDTAVAVNQVITATNINHLTFTPPSGWTGSVNFGWNGSDGITYASSSDLMNITITLRSLYLPLILKP